MLSIKKLVGWLKILVIEPSKPEFQEARQKQTKKV